MATSVPVPAAGVFSRIGGALSGAYSKLEQVPAFKWASGKVQDVVTSEDAIHGWQDIYKGWTTRDPEAVIKSVKFAASAGPATGAAAAAGKAIAGDAGQAAGAVSRDASSMASSAGAASGTAAATGAVARDVASNAGQDAGLVLEDGQSIDLSASTVALPDGFRETTNVDITDRQFIADLEDHGGLGRAAGRIAGGGSGAAGGLTGGADSAGGLGGDAGSAADGAGTLAKDASGGANAAGGAGNAVAGPANGASGEIEVAGKTLAKDVKPPVGMAAFKQGVRELFSGFMKAAKISGLVSAAISIVSNGYQVLTGQEGMPEAMGSVLADSADGFVSGGLTAVASGGVLALVGGLFGITAGLPFFLIGLAASVGFYALFDTMFKATFWGPIHDTVANFLGG